MTIHIRSTGGADAMRFLANAQGHDLPLGLPAPTGDGPDPHDYFDTALGGCKVLTLMLYAQRKQMPLTSVEVDVVRDASEERKGVYRLTVQLKLLGELTEAQREELLSVADRCPVHKLMTATDVQISTVLQA